MREKVINRADQDHPSRISQWDSGKGQLWQSDQRVEHILPHNIEGHHHFLTHQTWINLEDVSSPWRNDSKVNFGQPVPVCNISNTHWVSFYLYLIFILKSEQFVFLPTFWCYLKSKTKFSDHNKVNLLAINYFIAACNVLCKWGFY